LDRGWEPRLEYDFTRQVRLAALGHHRAERDGFNSRRIAVMALDQATHCVRRKRQRPELGECLARLDERRTGAGDDRYSVVTHGGLLVASHFESHIDVVA